MSTIVGNISLGSGLQVITAQLPVSDAHGVVQRSFIIDARLGSGNLADVFLLRNVDDQRENPEWVIKIGPKSFADQEASFLARYAQDLAPVLPRCGIVDDPVTIPGQHRRMPEQPLGALLLERVHPDHTLIRTCERLTHDLEREYVAWRAALDYARFVERLHRLGYSSNDRKLDDYFLIPSDGETALGHARLLVLDWNVVEPIAANGAVTRDLKELAESWRRLFRGSGEPRLDDPGMGHVSLAGQGWLWRALTGNLANAADRQGFDADVIHSLETLLEEFTTTTPGPVRPAVDMGAVDVAMPLLQIDAALLPTWQRIDMLLRRSELPRSSSFHLDLDTLPRDYSRSSLIGSLDEIRAFRREAQQYANRRVETSLRFSHLALREIRALRSQRSQPEQQALLDLWQQIVGMLSQTTVVQSEQSDTETRAHVVIRYMEVLAEYVADPTDLMYFQSEFRKLHHAMRQVAIDDNVLNHLKTLLVFVEGQVALVQKGPDDAQDLFEYAAASLQKLPIAWQPYGEQDSQEQQPVNLQENARHLLPADPTHLASRLSDLLAQTSFLLLDETRRFVREGQFELALKRCLGSEDVPGAVPGFVQASLEQELAVAQQALQLQQWITLPSPRLEMLEQAYQWVTNVCAYYTKSGRPQAIAGLLHQAMDQLKKHCVHAAFEGRHDLLTIRRVHDLGLRIQNLSMTCPVSVPSRSSSHE